MTKGIYKPTFVFVVALIFILTALAAVSASERESESVSYLIGNPSTTINFEGTVLSDTSLIGARRFEVRIDNRISGPEPCKNPIVVEMQVGPYCNGHIDSDIEVGDNVEVYGIYAVTGFGGAGCYVDLCMNGAYLKKKSDECCPCEIITDKETYKPDDPITITVRFCGPSPSGKTICGYIPSVQSFSFTQIEGCDGFNYAVWWEDTEIYHKVNEYTNKYIRLTGVVLKDPSGNGGRIVGFDAIEQISGCSACGISEYCDPKSFSVLIHSPDKTVTLTKKDAKKVSTGTYMFTGTIGDLGPRTVEVNVEGCSTMEKEFYVTSCCPCQITTRDPTAEIGYINPANHTDVIVRFASQCSDTICGRVTACFPWVHIKGCGRHGVNYYVLSDKTDIYNELSGHVLNYVRLTGVVIDGYGILGDPFIGGYDTIEEVSSCSECEGVQYCNPSSFSVLLHEQPDGTTDITDDFYLYTKGIYRVTLPAGDVGTKRIEVSAPGCPPIEREIHLIGSTICGQVHWSLEYASIEACDGLTYPVVTCAGYDLHDRLKEYDGKNVRLSSVVMEGYYDASTPCIADFDDILEISNCSECDSDKFIDGCTEISSPGYYKLISDIPNSAAQCCIKITASDVVFDGNGHLISAAEVYGVETPPDRCAVCVGSSTTLSNVTVKNIGIIRDWGSGIRFDNVTEGKIEKNNLWSSNHYGILLRGSSKINITNNEVNSCNDGIFLMDSSSNKITNNTASANYDGIGFIRSSSNNVINNTASGGYLGIDLYQDSNNNYIANNTVEYNLNHGLYIDSSSTGNIINQNVICSNNRIAGEYYDMCNNATNSGENNTCYTTYNWNDTGTTGCTHWCNDWDKDGILDKQDNCPYVPNPDQGDMDSDEIGDVCDPDIDGDGRNNDHDNCPEVANHDQQDIDGDGIGDVCDDDKDGDGHVNAQDNCPAIWNPNQENADYTLEPSGGEKGDACDDDDDNDGKLDLIDACPTCVVDNWLNMPDGCPFAYKHGYAFRNSKGKCFGMAWTAAMYYSGELQIEGRVDRCLQCATANMTIGTQKEVKEEEDMNDTEKKLWKRIVDYHHSGRELLARANTLAATGADIPIQLSGLREYIGAGKPCLVQMGVFPPTGAPQHTVLAYAYKYDGPNGTCDIGVYDPNTVGGCCARVIHVKLSKRDPVTNTYLWGNFKYTVQKHDYGVFTYISASKSLGEETWDHAAGVVDTVGGVIGMINPFSSAELHAYDSQGRHTGPDGYGGIEKGIPGSEYEIEEDSGAQTIIIPSEEPKNFTFKVLGTSAGTFNMVIMEVVSRTEKTNLYQDMPLTGSTVAELEVGPGSDQILEVDGDGDGSFETRKSPDVTFSDSDGDGLPDAWESQYGTQVNISDAGDDPDGDGLTNYEEYMWGSDPLNPDTDADGVFDSLDVCHGYDDSVDSDGDGIPDGCDVSLVIGNVEVSVQGNSATISWETDKSADSLVKYGTEPGVYNWQEYDALLVESHEVTLTELQAGKKYYYVVCSTDEGGNPSESNEYDFTTLSVANLLPVASFTFSPADPLVNDEITFNASASYDPDGYITNYEWDFGDGNTVNTAKKVISHTYHSAGDYRVNLTLTDNDGATDSSHKIIHVSAKPEVTTYDYNISGTVEAWSTGDYDPKADYANLNFNPDHKPFGELLIDWETKSSWAQIHRLDVYDRTADIVVKTTGWNQMGLGRSGQYKWNLSTLVTNFSHDHSIRTWVSSGTARVPTDIQVRWNVVHPVAVSNQPPVASFSFSPEDLVVNDELTFNASASYDPDGYITNYEWDFGDIYEVV